MTPSQPQICALKGPGKPGRKGRMPKFPVILKKRGAELRIYPPSKTKNRYRVLYRLGSKRVERVYPTYDEAKREADAILRKIQTQGAHSLHLSNQEAREYLDLKLKASKRGMRVADVIADWSDATELLDDPRDLVKAVRAHNRSKPERLLSLEESVSNYIASRKGQVAKRTFDGLCQALERFSQSFAINSPAVPSRPTACFSSVILIP